MRSPNHLRQSREGATRCANALLEGELRAAMRHRNGTPSIPHRWSSAANGAEIWNIFLHGQFSITERVLPQSLSRVSLFTCSGKSKARTGFVHVENVFALAQRPLQQFALGENGTQRRGVRHFHWTGSQRRRKNAHGRAIVSIDHILQGLHA